MSKSQRSGQTYKENMNKGKPVLPKNIKHSQRSGSSISKPPVSHTPNFGRSCQNVPQNKSFNEESLNISEICKKDKTDVEMFSALVSDENVYPGFTDTTAKIVEQHCSKYEKALILLSDGLKVFQTENDEKILKLHEQVASLKNSVKVHDRIKENLEKKMNKSMKTAKNLIELEYMQICKEINENQRFSKENINKLHLLNEGYELRLQENEDYLSRLKAAGKSEQNRSKSSINSYFSNVAEENKRLRENLSKLLNNPN